MEYIAGGDFLPSEPGPAVDTATRRRRLSASLVDGLLLAIPAILVGAMIVSTVMRNDGLLDSGKKPTDAQIAAFQADLVYPMSWFSLGALIAVGTYSITFTALRGQTIGKKVCGIRVIRMDGEPPGWTIATVRFAALYSPQIFSTWAAFAMPGLAHTDWIVTIAGLVIVAPVGFDSLRRGLHDFAAGTVVIREPART